MFPQMKCKVYHYYYYYYPTSNSMDLPHLFLNIFFEESHGNYNNDWQGGNCWNNNFNNFQSFHNSNWNNQHNNHYHHHHQHQQNYNKTNPQFYQFYDKRKKKGKNNYGENQIYTENNSENFIESPMTHLRGLVNIASTCYMNSILQCFCHITEMTNYFKTPKMNQLAYNNYNNNKLFPVFHEVIINLWNTWDSSPYSPYNFKNRLGQMNPLFQGAYPNDAKDLLTFILLQLHDELNNPKNNNINNNNNIATIIEQKNKKLMFEKFTKNFIKNYRSVISGLFFGLFYTKTECQFCHSNFYNYQTFNFIIFPLEKVLNYKMSLTNYTSNCNNTVSIEDCFKHYQLTTTLNNYYCNFCKNIGNSNYTTKFSILPNVFIIILNRGQGLQYKVNISFENENIGLKDYVEYCKEESVYELVGLVTHYGDSSASGHFMARCKSPIDGYWYLYNDQIVTKIGYFDKNTFAQGNPYILFYKKIHFQK